MIAKCCVQRYLFGSSRAIGKKIYSFWIQFNVFENSINLAKIWFYIYYSISISYSNSVMISWFWWGSQSNFVSWNLNHVKVLLFLSRPLHIKSRPKLILEWFILSNIAWFKNLCCKLWNIKFFNLSNKASRSLIFPWMKVLTKTDQRF